MQKLNLARAMLVLLPLLFVAAQESGEPQWHALKKVVYYDRRYWEAWTLDPEIIAEEIARKSDFALLDADALKAWMQAQIKHGAAGSTCIMSNGVAPATVAETPSKDCTIRRYMDAGGRVVWIGDVPFFYQAHDTGLTVTWGRDAHLSILGVRHAAWDVSDAVEITAEGKKWGVTLPDLSIRPASAKDVTTVLTRGEGDRACTWFKNYNEKHPMSGFVRYRGGPVIEVTGELVDDVMRLATHGISFEVHAAGAAPTRSNVVLRAVAQAPRTADRRQHYLLTVDNWWKTEKASARVKTEPGDIHTPIDFLFLGRRTYEIKGPIRGSANPTAVELDVGGETFDLTFPDFPVESTYYRLETVEVPDGIVCEVGGMTFLPDGTLMVATRRGEVWAVNNPGGKTEWKLFTDGLDEPLGIIAGRPGEFFVAQKPELTRVADTDGDGKADKFDTLADDWNYTGHAYEWTYGPVRDSFGNFWGTLSCWYYPREGDYKPDYSGMEIPRPQEVRDFPVPLWRGWLFKVTPFGEFVPWCIGLRSPNGIGLGPDEDIFITDNQGNYFGTSPLMHAQRSDFLGHPVGYLWGEDYGKNPFEQDIRELQNLMKPAAVLFPYGEMGRSLAEPAWDRTGGRFGPFEGQVFVGDQTQCVVMRATMEKVGGQYQGACYPFRSGFQCGINRSAFAPDGSLWVGQTDRGWKSIGSASHGIERIAWTGKVPMEIHTMSLKEDGFELAFTKPVDPATAGDPATYSMQRYHYHYYKTYGSPKVAQKPVKVKRVEISADGKRVRLALPEIVTGKIYELHVRGVKARDGSVLLHPTAYYTVNRTVGAALPPQDEPLKIDLDEKARSVDVLFRGNSLLKYVYPADAWKPYVKEMRTITGLNVLRDAPHDHLHHHGLMYAIGVNGVNFWEEAKGRSGYQVPGKLLPRSVGKDKDGNPFADFGQMVYWVPPQDRGKDPAKHAFLREKRMIRVGVNEAVGEVAVRWSSEFEAGPVCPDGKATLGGSHYFGLGMRFPTDFDLGAAEQRNSHGPLPIDGKEHKNIVAKWNSIFLDKQDKRALIAMFGHPRNKRGDSNFFAMKDPFAYISATQDLKSEPLVYREGETFRLDYLVVAYPVERSPEFLNKRYAKWEQVGR